MQYVAEHFFNLHTSLTFIYTCDPHKQTSANKIAYGRCEQTTPQVLHLQEKMIKATDCLVQVMNPYHLHLFMGHFHFKKEISSNNAIRCTQACGYKYVQWSVSFPLRGQYHEVSSLMFLAFHHILDEYGLTVIQQKKLPF